MGSLKAVQRSAVKLYAKKIYKVAGMRMTEKLPQSSKNVSVLINSFFLDT